MSDGYNMPSKTFLLTDAGQGIQHADFSVSQESDFKLNGSSSWSISKRTLRGGVSEAVEVIDVDNGSLRLSVLPTRGMGIWQGEYALGANESIPIGWKSPVAKPVHPAFVNLTEHNGLGFLSGFNELLCRCGLASNGPPGVDEKTGLPLTLHGKIANIPAHHVEACVSSDGPGQLLVTGTVDETMLFGPCLRLVSTLETEAGANWFRICDEVTNLAGQQAELELLYHINLGKPFLEEGAAVVAPAREVVPQNDRAAEDIETWNIYQKPTAGYREQVYYLAMCSDEQNQTRVLLKNSAGNHGVSLKYDTQRLPCFVLWKNTQAEADGYVTGLEPATNYPNFKSFEREQGRVITLAPGESYQMDLEFALHMNSDEIASVEADISRLQQDTPPLLHQKPHPDLSAG
jgi:hypothetical protein